VTFTNEPSFPKLIADADVLVSEASSVCLEALACGVPVIVMENDAGLTYDPMPNAIPGELYRRVRSGEQLSEAVLHYADLSTDARERQRALGLEIRAGYFERLTHEGINRFMHVNTVEEPANA
jgi:glycosyltransferase involved in cell wall biosynthesis